MRPRFRRRGRDRGTRALVAGAALTLATLIGPRIAAATEPDAPTSETTSAAEGPLPALAEPLFELDRPALLAYLPGPASFVAPVPVYAKRASQREFDTSMGERDPRTRQRPRTHRFRLAIHSHWVRLPRTQNLDTGEVVRFHFAPLMLDLGYQAQFLRFVMVRLAVAAGYNVANSRNAMPGVVYPQVYLGYQGKVVGAAFGYGFDWTIPPTFGARDPSVSNALEQPVITRNHVVKGELSATSKIDRVAMTFALAIGGIQSDLSHYDTVNRKWRLYLGFQAGVYFDGTIRREKKARKAADPGGKSK